MQVVNGPATISALTTNLNPVVVGQTVTFAVIVSPAISGLGIPSGTVNFFDAFGTSNQVQLNATPLNLDSGGRAALTMVAGPAGIVPAGQQPLGFGTHAITAVFTSADTTTFSNSTSNTVSQVVNKASTQGQVEFVGTPPASINSRSPSRRPCVRSSPEAGRPLGTVTFFDNLGFIALGTADLTAVGSAIPTQPRQT